MIKGFRFYAERRSQRRLLREAEIDERDYFLVSFPKSGNTWLRYILARALYQEEQISFNNITDYFPTVYKTSAEQMRRLPRPRYIKSHSAQFSLYGKCIYLYRDYRAVVLSAWFQARNKKNYTGSLKEFALSREIRSYGPWHWHVGEAMKQHAKSPDKILLLQYEKMLESPRTYVERILDYCTIKPIISIDEILAKTAFASLRKMEEADHRITQDETYFFRSGTSDNWRDHITPAEERLLMDSATTRLMQKLDYI